MAEARSCRPVSTGGLGVRVAVGVGVGGVGHASAVVLMDLIAEGGP